MGEVRFTHGDVVFQEGEASREVLLIHSGQVEVIKAIAGGHIVLGRAGAGEVSGEMGVIEGRPRSATVRAVSSVVGELLDRDAFLARISSDRELAFNALLRFSERLRSAHEWLTEATPAPAMSGMGAEQQVTLTAAPAAGAALLVALAPAGLVVDHFPFLVGRRPAPHETAPETPADLILDDDLPYRLSIRHFALLQTAEGELVVADAQSRLGTVVNGEPIGGPFFNSRAQLRHGENSIVAGGEGSPFVFRVSVG